MLTLHVLAGGELFKHVLNAMATLMKQDNFFDLVRLTALIGIVMVTCQVIKTRNPFEFAKWLVAYVLITQATLIPKTTVMIQDISSQTNKKVDNVPVVFALGASLLTTIGYSLAQNYDALFSMPDDLRYTQTGSLFASRLIQASISFRIIDPQLQAEINDYFRVCVVGDIRLNHKYGVEDLMKTTDLWSFISAHPSPLRRIPVNGKIVTCEDASKPDGAFSLRQKLTLDMRKAYTLFGVNFFEKPKNLSYEKLFITHLTSAFQYYQGLTDETSNVFLQSMMINALQEGMMHYQTLTDATAGIVNHQFTKSQLQHRWSWQIAGIKALWFLPLLHTWLTLLLFGIFPVVLALATLPSGLRIMQGYWQFLLSLQCWPLLFAILNAGMTIYGQHQTRAYGMPTLINLNQLEQVHQDLSAVTGYLMMLIPFLANGLVSNLSAAFSHLASSLTSHVQGSTMAVAGEAASSSFSFGQTSFYNTNANTFSANKHDSNWTHLQGSRTEQMDSGVLKTRTASGDSVFDVSPAMSRNAVSINTSEGLSASLNDAYEQSTQAAHNQSAHYQQSLSNFAHRTLQLSQLAGHDSRLGEGVSQSESGQYSKALSTISHIAEEVAHRTGVSQEDALARLTSGGWGAQVGVKSQGSAWGKLAEWGTGFHAGADAHLKFDRSSSSSDRYHEGVDSVLSAREAQDFHDALNLVKHFSQSHHFDDSHSQAASLSNQLGADLREAETASREVNTSLSKAARIQQARNYVESHSSQINTDLNQAFTDFVARQVGESARDELFNHPGDRQSLDKLQALGQSFITSKRDELIAQFGSDGHKTDVEALYEKEKRDLIAKEHQLGMHYQKNSGELIRQAKSLGIDMDTNKARLLQQNVHQQINTLPQILKQEGQLMTAEHHDRMDESTKKLEEGKVQAQKNVILPEGVHLPKEF